MKVKVLSLLVPALLVAGAANAAEVYNKDGNPDPGIYRPTTPPDSSSARAAP